MEKDKITAIILSAGYSSRMGKFKPLLDIGGKTSLERIADTLKSAGIEKILVVSGYKREALQPVLKANNLMEVYNIDYDKGMFESVKAGIRAGLTKGNEDLTSGFLLIPVDYPLIPKEAIEMIVEEHRKIPGEFIVPCYKGKKGHPLLIPIAYIDEIMDYSGDRGLKGITSRHEDNMIRVDTNYEAVVLDMDTPTSYEEILKYYKANVEGACQKEEKIQDRLTNRRLFLIRHGEIQQHREKIFLGQYNPPLSEKGRRQAEEASKILLGHKLSIEKIYSSDLVRATETASIISTILAENIEIMSEPGLREMSLGQWDGCYISEIKKQQAERYEERGKNLLRFKIDNDSENFYDLRYRAAKSIAKILDEDENQDIVVVTHSGVIKTLMSVLYNLPLDEAVRQTIANGEVKILDERFA